MGRQMALLAIISLGADDGGGDGGRGGPPSHAIRHAAHPPNSRLGVYGSSSLSSDRCRRNGAVDQGWLWSWHHQETQGL